MYPPKRYLLQTVSRLLSTGILVLIAGASVCSATLVVTTGNNSIPNFNGPGPLNTSGLKIGNTADGTLDVSDGGQVVNTGLSQLGVATGATGTATITGAGSLWSNQTSLSS